MPDESSRPERSSTSSLGSDAAIPRAEWAVASLGLVLVLGAIGVVLHTALFVPPTPPDVVAEVARVMPVRSGHLVEIRASNLGGTTAAEVTIEGELKKGEETVETAEATFDFVPPQSDRTAGIVFQEDPAQYRIELRTTGYRAP